MEKKGRRVSKRNYSVTDMRGPGTFSQSGDMGGKISSWFQATNNKRDICWPAPGYGDSNLFQNPNRKKMFWSQYRGKNVEDLRHSLGHTLQRLPSAFWDWVWEGEMRSRAEVGWGIMIEMCLILTE